MSGRAHHCAPRALTPTLLPLRAYAVTCRTCGAEATITRCRRPPAGSWRCAGCQSATCPRCHRRHAHGDGRAVCDACRAYSAEVVLGRVRVSLAEAARVERVYREALLACRRDPAYRMDDVAAYGQAAGWRDHCHRAQPDLDGPGGPQRRAKCG